MRYALITVNTNPKIASLHVTVILVVTGHPTPWNHKLSKSKDCTGHSTNTIVHTRYIIPEVNARAKPVGCIVWRNDFVFIILYQLH